MRRVVITGLGLVTPVGIGVREVWPRLLAGENGIRPITRFDTSGFRTRIAGEIPDFDPGDRLSPSEFRRWDRYAVYAVHAADQALEDAGLLGHPSLERAGVIFSSGIGGLETLEKEMLTAIQRGYHRVSPFLVPMMIPDMAAGLISIRYGMKGPNFCIVSACASSLHAVGEAFRKIQQGEVDVVVAGGSEAPITPIGVAGFASMRALSARNEEPEKASRPFDRDRDGFVMGEGAGAIVLEELSHALRRGARIYAEVAGYGATADAYHITAPCADGEGAVLAMEAAIRDAGAPKEAITYVNAHGTSTPLNDKAETLALKRVFGDHAYRLAVSSTKSMIGHLLGAAGAVELAATALSVYHQEIHPTRNLEHPDPDCDLDYVPGTSRKMEIPYALKASYGFGGHNAVVVLKRFEA